jgi:hypothetical protein
MRAFWALLNTQVPASMALLELPGQLFSRILGQSIFVLACTWTASECNKKRLEFEEISAGFTSHLHLNFACCSDFDTHKCFFVEARKRSNIKTASVFFQPAFFPLEITVGAADELPEARGMVVLKQVTKLVELIVFIQVRGQGESSANGKCKRLVSEHYSQRKPSRFALNPCIIWRYWRPSRVPLIMSVPAASGELRPTTLRDARKLGLVPSVTNILGVIAKPELMAWMQEQAVMAALTLPRIAGETEDSFAKRVVADSQSTRDNAADFGTSPTHASLAAQWTSGRMSFNHRHRGCLMPGRNNTGCQRMDRRTPLMRTATA